MSANKSRAQARRQEKSQQQIMVLLAVGIGMILLAFGVFLGINWAKGTVTQASIGVQPEAVNFAAPDVALTDLNNKSVSLADYKGQVVLYNAWATWCPPCKEEMPTLNDYYQAHHQDGFVVVAIEDGEPASEVADFVKSHGLTFPVWPDPKFVATTAFKTNNLPTSFVIDRQGTVLLTWTGAITRDTLEKYVTPLIQK